MRLRYTAPAARGLDEVLDQIVAESPQGARHVQERIQAVTELLLRFPKIGKLTKRPGMRRIVVTPYPYLVFYREGRDEIVVHAVRHAARRPSTTLGG